MGLFGSSSKSSSSTTTTTNVSTTTTTKMGDVGFTGAQAVELAKTTQEGANLNAAFGAQNLQTTAALGATAIQSGLGLAEEVSKSNASFGSSIFNKASDSMTGMYKTSSENYSDLLKVTQNIFDTTMSNQRSNAADALDYANTALQTTEQNAERLMNTVTANTNPDVAISQDLIKYGAIALVAMFLLKGRK